MEKKRKKKSWLRHQRRYCFCYYCLGDDKRLIRKTRSRKKYLKHRNRDVESTRNKVY